MPVVRRRVTLGAITALVVLVALTACSAPPPPPPAPSAAAPSPSSTVPSGPVPSGPVPLGPQYRDQVAGFALTPPAGFRPSGSEGSAVAAAFALPGEGPGTLRASLTVVVTPTDGDLAANVSGARQMLRVAFPDYQSTVDEPITLPNGQAAWLQGGTYTLRGAKVRTIQLGVVAHQTSYVVTGLTSAAIFGEFEPVFRATFNTFTLL